MSVIPGKVRKYSRRGANVGASFAFVTAYVLFAMMFLLMLADLIFTIVRAW